MSFQEPLEIRVGRWRSLHDLQHLSKQRPNILYACVNTRYLVRGGVFAYVPGQIALRMALIFLARAECVVSYEELYDHLYGGDIDGGPVTARNIISIRMLELRPILAVFGLILETNYTRGIHVRKARIGTAESLDSVS